MGRDLDQHTLGGGNVYLQTASLVDGRVEKGEKALEKAHLSVTHEEHSMLDADQRRAKQQKKGRVGTTANLREVAAQVQGEGRKSRT